MAKTKVEQLARQFSDFSLSHGVVLLRLSLGVVFLWFGMLKVLGISPVVEMIKASYSFMPEPAFILGLGIIEVIIGLGMIFKIYLRTVLIMFWLQMFGTFCTLLFAPSLLINSGNIFALTTLGEFIAKNIVLITAGIVIWGYEVKHDD